MLDRKELEGRFDRHFPEAFLKGAVETIVGSYREAPRLLAPAGLDECDASWELPYKRRALIESRVRGVAQKYKSEGVRAQVCWAGGAPYTLLTSGPFELTVSMIEHPGALPRWADFRSECSLINTSLFAEYEDPEKRTTYYGILGHTPHPKDDEPAAIGVLFPDEQYRRTWHTIDLHSRFGWLFERPSVPEEKIESPEPKLRKNRGNEGNADEGREKTG